MTTQQISIQQFSEELKKIINQSVWRVIHPADGWLFLDLGKQYQDYILNRDGSKKPYTKGQYQLCIKGDWEIIQNDTSTESRAVRSGETQESYFTRMDNLVNHFPFKTISGINLLENNFVLYAENGFQLKVFVTGKDDALSLTIVEISADGKPISYTHHRFDKELGSLVEISSR